MTADRFDLGRRAGPDFLPPDGTWPQRPQASPVPTRIRTEPVDVAVAVAGPAPQPRRRSAAGIAMAAAGCLLVGGFAGGAAGLLTSAMDPATSIAQYRPAPGGLGTVPDAQSAADALLPSVVEVQAGTSRGSGFVIDSLGHVVTNSHVVQGVSRVGLETTDGRRTAARVVGTDPATDIAVLAVATDAPPPARLGVSSGLRIGQPVIAAGAPLGLSSTVTAGIVSSVDRVARMGQGPEQSMLQTDASINPGNSGGPLANLQGQVIGVNTAIATVGEGGAGNIGIGFAVPIDRALSIAEQIIDSE